MAVLLSLLPLLFVALVIGGIVWVGVTQSRKQTERLQAMAQRLGLTLTQNKVFGLMTDCELRGAAGGRALRFWTYTTGSGKSRTSWAAVSIQPQAANGLTFELQRQGFLTKVMELFGTKEITMGDPAFDAAWFIQTNQPDFLRAALVPEVRLKLMTALSDGAKGRFTLKAGEVCYIEQGTLASEPHCARLERQIPLLQDLADLAEVCAGQTP